MIEFILYFILALLIIEVFADIIYYCAMLFTVYIMIKIIDHLMD